ncbi:FAD-dependent oxidoreductase [Ningiella sp. W23]|uniref:FAD-dependent oxidoreductase n=1 Tax=Ningiella sp. W23 TaxID=3023715 RepID=UPI00375765CA
MGSSAGWELSKSGEEVLLIEQQDEKYTFGSSLGEARISRSLGEQGDIFSFLQQQSVAQTAALIDYLNETENAQHHSMDDIYRTSPMTYIRYTSQQNDVDRLLAEQADPYKFAPDSSTAKALFGMQIPDSLMIIREYKKYTGTLNPNVLISKLHKAMNYAGSDIWYNEKVISLTRKNALYEIQIENTKTGQVRTILSKKVVVAAGPYNGQVIKSIAPYFNELITPKRLFLSFLKINPSVYNSLSYEQQQRLQESYPVGDFSAEIYYSMIENYDTNGHPVLKVGGHFLRTEIDDLDSVWAKTLTQDEIEWSKINTIRYLNMLDLPVDIDDLEFVQGYSCVYSLTDSEVSYVTHIVDENNEIDKNIVLVGGMSGIGAKGSLAYGLIASVLLFNKDDPSIMYQKTKAALGVERLEDDIDALDN